MLTWKVVFFTFLTVVLVILYARRGNEALPGYFFAGSGHVRPTTASDVPVLWFAPFFSGGGYCSEAIAFLQGLVDRGVRVGIQQHGDSPDSYFLEGLPPPTLELLRGAFHTRVDPRQAVAVCHSEPGAWAVQEGARYSTSRCPPDGALYRVGRTMFETDRIPDGWSGRLNEMDEVWVPTAFHVRTFTEGGVEPAKLRVLGEPVDTAFFDPAAIAEPLTLVQLGLSMLPPAGAGAVAAAAAAGEGATEALAAAAEVRPFVFLSVFKWEERKAWDVLLTAYYRAFAGEHNGAESGSGGSSNGAPAARAEVAASCGSSTGADASDIKAGGGGIVADGSGSSAGISEDGEESSNSNGSSGESSSKSGKAGRNAWPVALVILTNAYHDDGADFDSQVAALARQVTGREPPELPPVRLLSRVPQSLMPALYDSANAFVLPSRGEGWGRPHVEAMSMALPVLATNWSGPTEYMNDENAYPIAIDGLVEVKTGAFRGHLWAEPSVEHLVRLMRHVRENPAEAAARGARARADMVRRYSPARVAEDLARLLGSAAAAAAERAKAKAEAAVETARKARTAAKSKGSPRPPPLPDEL